MPVNVGMTKGVGVDNMKITVFVAVGSGVSVFRGVGVKVSVDVDVGITAAVCEDAAFAVCTIYVLIAPGSSVGSGGADEKVGTHAMTKTRAVNQSENFILRFNIYLSRYISVELWGNIRHLGCRSFELCFTLLLFLNSLCKIHPTQFLLPSWWYMFRVFLALAWQR